MTTSHQDNEQDEDHGPEMLGYALIYCVILLAFPVGCAVTVMLSWLP